VDSERNFWNIRKQINYCVRFQVLMTASMKVRAFCVIAPCSPVGVGLL
jgi:hypothetical protein